MIFSLVLILLNFLPFLFHKKLFIFQKLSKWIQLDDKIDKFLADLNRNKKIQEPERQLSKTNVKTAKILDALLVLITFQACYTGRGYCEVVT